MTAAELLFRIVTDVIALACALYAARVAVDHAVTSQLVVSAAANARHVHGLESRIADLEGAVFEDDEPASDALPDLSVDVTADVDDEHTERSAEPVVHRDRKPEEV